MGHKALESGSKFDSSRAAEYEQQSRIALAGYDACHDLAACLLAAELGVGSEAKILVVGAGTRNHEGRLNGAKLAIHRS